MYACYMGGEHMCHGPCVEVEDTFMELVLTFHLYVIPESISHNQAYTASTFTHWAISLAQRIKINDVSLARSFSCKSAKSLPSSPLLVHLSVSLQLLFMFYSEHAQEGAI